MKHFVVATACMAMLSAREMGATARSAFWEPDELDFWSQGQAAASAASTRTRTGAGEERSARQRPLTIVRLTNTTAEEFESYHRRGIPVIVTDAVRDWANAQTGGMAGWTCETVRKMFKGQHTDEDAPIYLQYANGQKGGMHPVDLGSKEWQGKSHANGEEEDGREGPKLAPFYWGVKDGSRGPGTLFDRVSRLTKLPYFLPRTASNRGLVPATPEFWFSRPGAGAKAHVDSHCQSTMSVQLSGRKLWRIGPFPAIPNLATARPLHDGFVDTQKWEPLYEFELQAGEGLFFPSGFIHETRNTGDDCAASITFQFEAPQPTDYIRAYLPRLFSNPAMQECRLQTLYDGALLLGDLRRRPKRPHDARAVRSAAAEAVRAIDENGDGFLTRNELLAAAHRRRNEYAEDTARNGIAYHDTDGDGRASVAEVQASWVRWDQLGGFVRGARDAIRRYRYGAFQLGCRARDNPERLSPAMTAAHAALAKVYFAARAAGRADASAAASAARIPDAASAALSPQCAKHVRENFGPLLAAAHTPLRSAKALSLEALGRLDITRQDKPTATDEDEFDEFCDDFDAADGGGAFARGASGDLHAQSDGDHEEYEDGEGESDDDEERRSPGDDEDEDEDEDNNRREEL